MSQKRAFSSTPETPETLDELRKLVEQKKASTPQSDEGWADLGKGKGKEGGGEKSQYFGLVREYMNSPKFDMPFMRDLLERDYNLLQKYDVKVPTLNG